MSISRAVPPTGPTTPSGARAAAAAAQEARPAEHATLLRGGHIHAPGPPDSTAMLAVDGVISWLGSDADAPVEPGPGIEVVELDGALVTPAFVDAHMHLSQTGLALDGVDLGGARSKADMLDRLASYVRHGGSGVVLGFGWDDSSWDEPGAPTMTEIDRAVGDRPTYAARIDGHSAVLSSALAAQQPGLAGSEGWDGTGRVEREAHHLARDAAHALISAGQRRRALRRALDHAASLGFGCVHEISAPHINPPSDLATIRELVAETPSVTVVPYWGELGAVVRAYDLGCLGAAGDLNADGSFGSRTAALSRPYEDSDTSGYPYLTAEQVRDHVVACTRGGLQAGFHAIGDQGVSNVVDGMVAAAEVVGVEAFVAARHRVEHLEMVTAEQAATLARLGVVASVQPAFDAAWGGPGGMYATRLGVERAAMTNPYATLAAAGVTLAFGSDSPVTPLDPWGGIRAAVRHHTASQRLSVEAAFAAQTSGGWSAAKRDGAGELATGAPATYAVWGGVTTVFEAVEATPPCLRSVVSGHVVHDAGTLRR